MGAADLSQLIERAGESVPRSNGLGIEPAAPSIFRLSNQQVDLLAQRIAYWSRKKPDWKTRIEIGEWKPGSATTGGPATVRAMPADPRRIALIFAQQVASSIRVFPNPTPSANLGFIVQGTTLPLAFYAEQWGSMVGAEWWMNTTGAATLTWIELAAIR